MVNICHSDSQHYLTTFNAKTKITTRWAQGDSLTIHRSASSLRPQHCHHRADSPRPPRESAHHGASASLLHLLTCRRLPPLPAAPRAPREFVWPWRRTQRGEVLGREYEKNWGPLCLFARPKLGSRAAHVRSVHVTSAKTLIRWVMDLSGILKQH